jgi:hypothetical protein
VLVLTQLCLATLFRAAAPVVLVRTDTRDMSPEDRAAVDQAWQEHAVASEVRASLLSRCFFVWLQPLLRRGYRRALGFADLPPLGVANTAHVLTEVVDAHWQRERSQAG